MRKGLQGLMLGVALGAFGVTGAMAQQPPSPLANWKTITEETMRKPADGDWLMWRRTYANWGYSPLDQINKDNVKGLRVAWTWSLTSGVTEIEPLVHDGVLFVTNAGDKIQALNAANGDLLWEYRRDLPQKLIAAGGNTLAKRNMAMFGDQLYIATSDAHIVALDVRTGKVAFDHTVADWKKGCVIPAARSWPMACLSPCMSGCNAAQAGGCFITGHDPKTGEESWRVHTVAQDGDPNANTWNGLPHEQRFGGSAWIAGSYDPETEHDLSRRRPALSVDRGNARHARRRKRARQQRALYGFDARHRAQDRQDEMASPASRQRHARSRLCL